MDSFLHFLRTTFSPGVSPSDAEYIDQWIDRSQEQFLDRFRGNVLMILGAMEIGIYTFSQAQFRKGLLITNGILLFLALISPYLKRTFSFKKINLITIMLTINNLGYGWTLKSGLDAAPTVSGASPMVILYTIGIGFSIILNRLKPKYNLAYSFLFTFYTIFIYGSSGIQKSGDLLTQFVILATWNTIAFAIHFGRYQATFRAALLEKNQEDLFKRNENLKLESIKHELVLAQEIQDSISTPSGFTTKGGISGYFFQKKSGYLGGDWMGSFQSPGGNMYIVIVDATGKGIPAALVVHAVQSLWSAASTEPDFDPIKWIHDVNKTLITLGQKSPQTLSLGLITIAERTVTYESAGHVPLYFITKYANQYEIKSMNSRGNLLGVSENLQLVSESIDLDQTGSLWVVGGTDGVFVSGTRLSPREASYMLQKIQERKPEDLLATDVDDDKILLLLEKAA